MPPAITEDELKRRIVFVPCVTKKSLHNWIKVFLGLDLPDSIVDPDSNSSPMDAIWEVYERGLKNDKPDFSRLLSFASRDSFKTLGAAILELLMVIHLRRSVAHMAAIEQQAQKAQSYVKDFFSRPYLREYVVGDNKRKTEYLRYQHRDSGENVTQDVWESLPNENDRRGYDRIYNYINIILCTIQSTNSEHVPFMVIDEVDVVANPKAYEEAKLIPAPLNGQMPITLLTSTRKFSFGLVQHEIDNALDERGEAKLEIRHWNLIDVTARCPETRHRPDLPKLPVFRSDATLRTITPEDVKLLEPKEQAKYVEDVAYHGCVNNCRIFAMCKGRLATQQTSTSPLLKPVQHTQNQFGAVSVEMAQAQLLCWKPSTEGLIYSRFDRQLHMIPPGEMAEKLTGDLYPKTFTKADLVALAKARGLRFYAGMDFGYTHNFAVVTGFVDGNRMFVVDVIAAKGLELPQRIELCSTKLKHYDPLIYPDTAYPADIKTFKRAGYRLRDWDKKSGSVKGGIEIVRMKFMPAVGGPQLFLLQGDKGCQLLADRINKYHWKLDQTGEATDEPDDKDDDECDALRYMVMNVFAPGGKFAMDASPEPFDPRRMGSQREYSHDWVREVLREHLNDDAPQGTARGRRGAFIFDL